jgi:succinate dehydrogenase hydrophobic anchor subunit
VRSPTTAKGRNDLLQALQWSKDRLRLYARNRGWPFIAAWGHRVSGIFLVIYIWLHIITLSSLAEPGSFDAEMLIFSFFIFVFLEWLLAVPVIFHAVNGGRLILYEFFGVRSPSLFRWVLGLAGAYVAFLGVMMGLGNRNAPAIFFWAAMSIPAAGLTIALARRMSACRASAWWKLQRLSGAFLLAMIPAHMLFMHLSPSAGHEAAVILARMDHRFIKLVDLAIVVAALYHGGFGLISIAGDYLAAKKQLYASAAGIVAVMIGFGWLGIRLIFRA